MPIYTSSLFALCFAATTTFAASSVDHESTLGPSIDLTSSPDPAGSSPPHAVGDPSVEPDPPPSESVIVAPSAIERLPAPTPDGTAPDEPEPDDPESNEEDEADTSASEADGGHEPFELQPPAPDSSRSRAFEPRRSLLGRGRRTPVWGKVWLTGSILYGFDRVGLGASAIRFVLPRLGFGIDLDDQLVFDRHGTYNLFQLTPKAVFLLLPYRRVTPIAHTGFGGSFFSRQLGVYGRWLVGAGLMIAIRERLRIGFGLDVEGLLPKSRFYRHFECRGDGGSQDGCHIGLSPWVSFGFRG